MGDQRPSTGQERRTLTAQRLNFSCWASALTVCMDGATGTNRAHLAVLFTRLCELSDIDGPEAVDMTREDR